ncbi:MAG: hypothetical protein ABFD25_09210 [Clostridiaceae bacterium]
MKESRRYFIENKIFNKIDLKNIANIILKEYSNSKRGERNASIQYTINCFDNSTYESDSLSIVEEGGIIDIKKVSSIEYTYFDFKINRHILFYITEGSNNSYVKISGDDSGWVNKVFTNLTDYINSIKPQENWVIKYKKILRQIIALGLGKIFNAIITYIMLLFVQPIENPSEKILQIRKLILDNLLLFYFIYQWVLPWIVGLSWTPLIFDSISKLWPKIEFDFGPEHLKEFKNRRKKVNIFITLVMIPSIIMIVYDVIKNILNIKI